MSRRFVASLVFAALFVPLAGASIQAAPRSAAASPTFARIIALVNMHRASANLRPVTAHPILMAEAQRFSAVQARLGYLSHRGVDGTRAGQRLTRAGYRWYFYAENLAAGQDSADAVVAGWMASPSHRANIMNPKAREIGLGLTVREHDPSGYVNYWVMELGQRR